jgi:amidophosphoribosyltransferase
MGRSSPARPRRPTPTSSSRSPTRATPRAGYAKASGLPQDDGFVKNRYVARTFIQPGQELRKHGLRLKFNPLPETVAGKSLVVVDDSIVRGNTTRQIVQMLRDAGAARSTCASPAPPIRNPCHYGVDMSTREEMIAHGRTEATSPRSWAPTRSPTSRSTACYEAIEGERETHCDACFSGQYPLDQNGAAQAKDAFEAVPLPLVAS